MLVPPEKRIIALNFPASLRGRAHQRALTRKNRWAEKFKQQFTNKFSKKWRKQASEQGGLASLAEKSQGTAK
eukprot:3067783-Heterocapsa_arctica.AAC.1